MAKFTAKIEEALRDEGLTLSDCPEGFIDAALDTLIDEDMRRGRAPNEFERGVITMVVTAAKKAKGE